MRVDEFDYNLPPELIAQVPVEPRDSSRLMVVCRKDRTITHRTFGDILYYLHKDDAVVVNDTRVMPGRLLGRRESGGKVEVLLLRECREDSWECLARPGHKVRVGDKLFFGREGQLTGTVMDRTEYGGRVIRWSYSGDWRALLETLGRVPLPPYIKTPLREPERYQTVYASAWGSAAAPTAGLHFTPSLLKAVQAKGCTVLPVTLQVGLGTFRPVKAETVEEHTMHKEHVEVTAEVAGQINSLRERGGNVCAVGTTVVRTLETVASDDGKVKAFSGNTGVFIYPGYRFKAVDVLLTNFHLPRSTLLMMVCALGGRELIMEAYREAVATGYRFYSFGDAMLIT